MSRHRGCGVAFCGVVGIVSCLVSHAQVAQGVRHLAEREPGASRFADLTDAVGFLPYNWDAEFAHAAGVAAADYDGDGWVDLFVPRDLGEPDELYRNLGDGTFMDVAATAGVASEAGHKLGLFLDYDGDHDLDLLVIGDCFGRDCGAYQTVLLYRQYAPGLFEDVTEAAGLGGNLLSRPQAHCAGAVAGDINNDGYLDLYLPFWLAEPRVFLNNTDGTFTNITESSGVEEQTPAWQAVMHDFNGDGWQDVYVARDFAHPNYLWINQGDNTFVDRAFEAGVANEMADMGVALGDYDADGDLDIYVTALYNNGKHNVLFRNDSVGDALAFVEVAPELGCDNGWWGWGTTFLDFNLDGRLDIAATNGWDFGDWIADPTVLFQQGSDGFTNVAADVGFEDTDWGAGLIAADFDRDGDLDCVQSCINGGPLRLLRNDRDDDGNRWLVIQPRQDGPNHFAVGAVVRVHVGGRIHTRLVHLGTSLLSQEPFEAHFGLGPALRVPLVTIDWPDGSQSQLHDVATNQVLEVNR